MRKPWSRGRQARRGPRRSEGWIMMQFRTARISLSLAAAACLLLGPARACAYQGRQPSRPVAQEHEQQPAAGENTPSSPTKVAIPDVVVLDQNNQKVRFYSDLVKG